MSISLERNGILVRKKFFEFFFPSVLMSASSSISLIIDSVIVGNILGEDALAAMNLLMPMSLCFTALSAMFGIGSSTLIAALKGKIEDEKADKSFTLSGIAWIVLSLIGVCLGLFLSEPIAGFLSGNSGLESLVKEYLKVYLIGSPFTFGTLIFPYIVKADGRPRLSSNLLIVANVVNLCLDVVYMRGFSMGLAGASLATVTGNACGCALTLLYLCSKKRNLHFVKVTGRDFKWYVDMFKMSISSIFGQGLMFAKIWIFNMIIAMTAGAEGLTAYSICTACLSFVSMFIAGGAQTMIPMVSAFYGTKDETAVSKTVKLSLKIVFACCVIATLFFELFPQWILILYGVTGGKAFAIGIWAIRLFSLAFVGIGFSFMVMYFLQAIKMPAFSMQICALEGFIMIVPICFVMAHFLGTNGIWLSYVVNEIFVAIFILVRARQKRLLTLFYSKSEKRELTVDVSEEKEVEQAIQEMEEFRPLPQKMFALSRQAYRERNGCKKNSVVDVVIEENRITFKDLGKCYSLLSDPDLLDTIRRENDTFDNTLVIGMNYSHLQR